MLRRTMALRILLCDDQPDIVQSLALLFQSQGYETAVTYDGLVGSGANVPNGVSIACKNSFGHVAFSAGASGPVEFFRTP